MLNTPTFANSFNYLDIFIFSLIKSLSCNKTLKMLSLAKCAKLVDEKIIDYCVAVVPDFEPKILMKGVHLTNFEQNCSIES